VPEKVFMEPSVETTVKTTATDARAARLELLRSYLRDYPASVVAVSYVGDAPPLAKLGDLVGAENLRRGGVADSVLRRFVQRLQKARPDLGVPELLDLHVPRSAGDQEVYTARLGKWLFELRMLEAALRAEAGV
jgi:hypothetical protein